MNKKMLIFIVSAIVCSGLTGQVVTNPVFGLVSHETLNLVTFEFGNDLTVIELTIENRVSGGYFCVDRNTIMVLPEGTRLKMVRSEGLPNCPEVHNFSRIGEVLRFKLYFPALGFRPDWFDLIEECSENCFSVLGILTDPLLSARIDTASELAESGKPAESGREFREILAGLENSRHGIAASLYSNIIVMYLREGDEVNAKVWYSKMLDTSAPNLDYYIANLSARGIRWQGSGSSNRQ
ncbi:MAG: hypothetical protein FJY11_03000 [Bacteroidetes bacterium]|nr:hypothetical protein [Bacteroidota bacterium]